MITCIYVFILIFGCNIKTYLLNDNYLLLALCVVLYILLILRVIYLGVRAGD